MMKVAVCDDDADIRQMMQRILREYEGEQLEVDTYADGTELLLAHGHFGIVFLDIDMEHSNGIEVAKEIRTYDKQVKIIYLTNYRDYVGGAFAVHAFGYLLKPVRRKDIYAQLDDALNYLAKENEVKELEFQTTEGKVLLDVRDILFFEYTNRSIQLHTQKRMYYMKMTMTELAARMKSEGFEMTHKSFCVNLFHVKRVKGYDVELMNGERIPLSQKKSVEFRQTLNEYITEQIKR